MKTLVKIFSVACAAALFFVPQGAAAGDDLRLAAAYMCEQITSAGPENKAVVFSASEGKIFCFCYFTAVPEKTTIYHAWYHGDRLVARRKLNPEPPGWKGYSTMQLRETDKGPWRVEILGSDGRRFDTVRFSVTD
jgi:hypothetical protein